MTVFGTEAEQAVLDALTDEALAAAGEEAEEATPDDLPEEVAEDNTEAEEAPPEPQEQTAEAEPGTEPEQEPAAEPTAEPEPQPEPTAPETVEKSRYEAAVRDMNAKQREAAELNKQLEELRRKNQELQDSVIQMNYNQPMTKEEQTAFLQGLRDNPRHTMAEMNAPLIKQMVDQRLQEVRRQFDEAQRKQAEREEQSRKVQKCTNGRLFHGSALLYCWSVGRALRSWSYRLVMIRLPSAS